MQDRALYHKCCHRLIELYSLQAPDVVIGDEAMLVLLSLRGSRLAVVRYAIAFWLRSTWMGRLADMVRHPVIWWESRRECAEIEREAAE